MSMANMTNGPLGGAIAALTFDAAVISHGPRVRAATSTTRRAIGYLPPILGVTTRYVVDPNAPCPVY